ncbi:McrB family protein [Photobacterium kishitanii]|uniref:McrB family protein n=1 Tax=Photobacterium kishitanii TaxID=318456 RepID=UPI00071AECD9|nr:AAA family ATPase [Photobacterium kishitanii]
MEVKIYTRDELVGLSEKDLFDCLAKSWGVEDGKIEVWGELPPLGDNNFGFLRNTYLVKNGKALYYPLEGESFEPCRFFIAPHDAKKYGSKTKTRIIKCGLELSPESERKKHNNPFGLCASSGTCENLQNLPKEVPHDIITDNEKSYFISKSIYDFYYGKALHDIEADLKKRREKLERELDNEQQIALNLLQKTQFEAQESQEKRNLAIQVIETLQTKKTEIETVVEGLNIDKEIKQKQIIQLRENFEKIEAEMNKKIERLKNYVSEKALFLKTFEFIDEEDLDKFLLESKNQNKNIDGISFRDVLDGDYEKAVSYIQAYLVGNDILYPRHIIENYITLLRTKDLIVLAGDSGSGKTNLVKSFAKAVGGKSIIVPVKPNWTSSEDLMGYYNPLEKKYLATPFLDALLEAQNNPEIPYFICLDEMNLARVEYYFADFLSLLESRDEQPEIKLYSEDESSHVLSELKAVVDIIQCGKDKYQQDGIINFIELLKDEELNVYLRQAFGFSDKDSLIKYHSEIRRMLSAVMTMPSSIKMPANVHIVGAINIDETTHYLSPKILDRAHIMRFESPLLSDWDAILKEVEEYDFGDVTKPLLFDIEALGIRQNYPKFDRNNPFCELFIYLNKEFFHKIGVEFGMRTIRQGLNYLMLFQDVNSDNELAINNFLLHKVFPKFTFDGNKNIGDQSKLELIEKVLIDRIMQQLPNYESYSDIFSAVNSLETIVKDAKANDGVVNFWS